MHKIALLLMLAATTVCLAVKVAPTNEELAAWIKDGTLSKGETGTEKPPGVVYSPPQRKPVATMDSHDWKSVLLVLYMAVGSVSAIASGGSLFKAWRRHSLLRDMKHRQRFLDKRD